MGRPRSEEVRILGPYEDKAKKAAGKSKYWKTVEMVPGEKPRWTYHESEQDAQDVVDGAEQEKQEAAETTVSQLIELYLEQHQAAVKNNRDSSRYAVRWNLHRFFLPMLASPINELTERTCRECRTGRWKMVKGAAKPVLVVDGLATRKLTRKLKDGTVKVGKPATPTSQLGTLGMVRTFTKWAVAQRHLKVDPMAWFDPNLEPVRILGGKGKTELSLNQAKKFLRSTLDVAMKEAGKGDIGGRGNIGDQAAAVAVALVTGLRASTVVHLLVSSIERGDEGEPWVLWAKRAKKRGVTKLRPYPLEPEMQAIIERQIARRQPTDRLFGEHRREWLLKAVRRMCDLAGVPRATVHAIRGMIADKEIAGGDIAAAQRRLDHERASTTLASYASDAAQSTGDQRVILGVLAGGKR